MNHEKGGVPLAVLAFVGLVIPGVTLVIWPLIESLLGYPILQNPAADVKLMLTGGVLAAIGVCIAGYTIVNE